MFCFQVTADEAVFVLGIALFYKQGTNSFYNSDSALKRALSLSYQRLLAHQSQDGSFTFCQQETWKTPSTFLTASALDVLRRLQQLEGSKLALDGLILRKTVYWLKEQQSLDGSFREKFVFDGIYQRKIPIDFQEIALTSHVLIALSGLSRHEIQDFNVTSSIEAAAKFLANRLEILDRSGTSLDIALVARALQVSNSPGAEAAFEILAKNRHEEGKIQRFLNVYWEKCHFWSLLEAEFAAV